MKQKILNQLKYFQEDMAWKLDVIATILLFGMGFPAWLCWASLVVTIMQLFYTQTFGGK